MKKQSLIDNEEIILTYLQSLKRDANNVIILGTKRYSEIKDISPDQFVQTLSALQDMGYVELELAGSPGPESMCFVTMKESALTYFEDQDIKEDTERRKTLHDYSVNIVSGIIGAIFGAIITLAIQRLLG